MKSAKPSPLDRLLPFQAQDLGLEIEQLQELHAKLAKAGWEYPYGVIDKAREFLAPNKVLLLFNTEDLHQLYKNGQIVDELNAPHTPFFTLKELRKEIIGFLDYLQQNKQHLLDTGYPEFTYKGRSWLEEKVNRLYPVKRPLIHPTSALFSPVRIEKWGKIPEWIEGTNTTVSEYGFWWNEDEITLSTGDQVIPVDYSDATFIPGFSHKDEERLLSLREKIFDLRLVILQHICDALIKQDGEFLLGEYYRQLSLTLSPEEMSYLIRYCDQYDRNVDPFDYYQNVLFGSVHYNPRIFSELDIVRHVMSEIEIGRMHHTREAFKEFQLSSYFQTFGQRWRNKVDRAISRFRELEADEKAFNEEFWKGRNGRAIESNYLVTTKEGAKVAFADLDEYKRMMRDYAKLVESFLTKERNYQGPIDHSDRNIIQRRKKDWTFMYMGKQCVLNDKIGVRYIVHLINADSRIHATELWYMEHPGEVRVYDRSYDTIDPEIRDIFNEAANGFDEFTHQSRGDLGDGEDESIEETDALYSGQEASLDKEATDRTKKLIIENITQSEVLLKMAEENRQWERYKRIAKDIKQLKHYYDSMFDIRGLPREVTKELNRKRVSVYKAIKYTIENEIEPKLSSLATHLTRHINKGTYFQYTGSQKWIVD